MSLNYNHDLRAADKNIASSMELIKAAKADLKPKLSGDANFQYTGNPIELTVNLPQSNPYEDVNRRLFGNCFKMPV